MSLSDRVFRTLPCTLAAAIAIAAAVPARAQQDAGAVRDMRALRLDCRTMAGDGELARIDTSPAATAGANGKARSVRFDRPPSGERTSSMRVGVGETAECAFPSGRTVRVKVGEGEARPYGMCGGDPEVFMSVWVDGRKVESRRWFAGHCYRSGAGQAKPDILLEFERNGARTRARSCLAPGQARGREPACTAYPDLAGMPPDTVEYPPAARPAPRPGTIELLAGADEVCREARAALAESPDAFDKDAKPSRRFTYPAWRQVDAPTLPDGLQGAAEQSVFDLNNDGKPERVLKRVFESNYMDGNVLLARYGSTAFPMDWSPASPSDLAYLPCQLADRRIAIARCPPLSQDGDEANFTMPAGAGQEPVEFRNRYISVTPFFYRNKTYLGISRAARRTHAAVLEPLPSGGFRQACLLRRAGKNF